jgi:histidinol dehydrogenase
MRALRFRGRYRDLPDRDRMALRDRALSSDPEVARTVAAILADVRVRGDSALRELAARFDGIVPASLEVPAGRMRRALDALDSTLREAMQRSLENIARVHRASLPRPVTVSPEPGITITRRADALGRVGIYAPGGRAAYPSSVLMAAVPARVAGVGEVILCSPPSPSTNGQPSDIVLAAAALAGVDRVFSIGGAGAIAAMAFGTASVSRVDRIVGPGNAWVAEAKLQVVGSTGIDAPAGPSELLVIADDLSSPSVIATEMLAQAEHDPAAWVIALCVGERVADAVERALMEMIDDQPRAEIIRAVLEGQGGVIAVDSLAEALGISNDFAPEHLLLAGGAAVLDERVRNAGTVFIGQTSSVAFGDYMTGANHVLPTGGLARSYSGLSVLDFMRWTTCQRVERDAAHSVSSPTAAFAKAEGLPGHAAAARLWSDT